MCQELSFPLKMKLSTFIEKRDIKRLIYYMKNAVIEIARIISIQSRHILWTQRLIEYKM